MTGQPPAAKSAAATEQIVKSISPHFKMVFLTVTAITGVFFLANLAIVLGVHNPTDQMKSFVTTTTALYQAGFGAIVGLIGGKAA
jgi:uncharacterized membrane protein